MSHLKDKKITIYFKSHSTDPEGYPIEGFKPVHPGSLWAYKRQFSAKEYYAAKTTNIEEELLFIVNWRADLITENSINYYIRYGDEWYDIERIDTYEGYKNDLRIYAKRMDNRPDPGDILPYA